MSECKPLPIEALRETFSADFDTGILTRLKDGKETGSFDGKYLRVYLDRDHPRLPVHRVIWALAYGETPTFLDHINGNSKDNRLSNLRETTTAMNARNAVRQSNNSTGYSGVSKDKYGGYNVHIGTVYLGYFKSLSEAIEARRIGELVHGYSDRHGEPPERVDDREAGRQLRLKDHIWNKGIAAGLTDGQLARALEDGKEAK